MSKELRIIVRRVDIDNWEEEEKLLEPGSVILACYECGDSVWLTPDGHRLAYELHPDDSEVICIDCHLKSPPIREDGGTPTDEWGQV